MHIYMKNKKYTVYSKNKMHWISIVKKEKAIKSDTLISIIKICNANL